MTHLARHERDDVVDALRPEAVLVHFGIKGRRCGREFRTRTCPACGERTRADAVAVNLKTGMWRDHAHGCAGDLLALVAGFAGMDAASQFREVLALAADIAGVEPTVGAPTAAERAQRRADASRRAAERDAAAAVEEARREQAAITTATRYWGRLATRSTQGEQYLEGRGVLSTVELGLVRFIDAGDIAIPLYTADGAIVNVVRRRIDGREPKVLGLKDCPTAGTFVGSIAEIVHGRSVVLVEGVFDALTARLAWPDAVILGAHGASNIPKIAAAAAPRIKLARPGVLLVPHADQAGVSAMTAAGKHVIAAGLRLHEELQVLHEITEPDLNDAWCAGWRPR